MPKPFPFRTLARLREARRDAARAHLGEALRAAETLESRLAEATRQQAVLAEQRREATAAGTADASWLLNAGRYDLVLRGDQRLLRKNLDAIEAEIERRRGALADAEREVRALEVLRDRHVARERRAAAKREGRLLDEFSAARRASAEAPFSTP
ncbi:flagellar export protein FliJ [Botrimarina sp.]|uniref:flagellar export protein FliJ n=1 Tax=Botrimarina sp. TaxID=2795802 RepID=UPI0032F05534